VDERCGVVQFDRHTGGREQFGVANPVVAQRVVTGDTDTTTAPAPTT
jgi:hypothetical protein